MRHDPPDPSRRRFLRTAVAGGLGLLGAPHLARGQVRVPVAGAKPSPVEVSTRAVDLVLGTTVVDMLGLLTLDWPRLAGWHADPLKFTEDDYRLLEASGVRVFHPAVETRATDPHRAALRWLAGWNRLLDGQGCFLARVAGVNDLLHVAKRGEIGVVLGFQDADHFRTAADVEAFHALGQRVSQLTYNERNRLGSGCYERVDRGLTAYGGAVVAAMNRVGMAVDVSHCGERTSFDAIEASRGPVLVTHANCRALVPRQPRGKSDAVLRALAAKGGVVGITTVRAFVGGDRPTLEDLLDHFGHAAHVAGIEHVGLGSDVDVTARDPATGRERSFYEIRGLDQRARVFQIADGLLRRGFSAADVELVLGGNFRRALAAIWPADTFTLLPERLLRRDPFCPAPRPAGP